MRFARIGDRGAEHPVVVDGQRLLDLTPLTADITPTFLETGLDAARDAVERARLPVIETTPDLRFGSPVPQPSALLCIGMNYAAHAAESGSAPPTRPILFLKTPNTIGGPEDDVAIPRGSTRTDWEVELGVVIGRRASYLADPADSMAHVAGFVLANDLSEREWQLELSGGQWSMGKCAPGFSPLGPWLVTPDEVDHRNLRLRSWVNGEPRQDSTTADLIFDVETIVWQLSQHLALDPGDVILTGTPAGVGPVRAGQRVEVEVEGIGVLSTTFTAPE